MPPPADARASDEGSASGGIPAILDGHRPDPAVPDGQGELEQRLRQVVERLERTARALDAMLDSLAGRPLADAAEALSSRRSILRTGQLTGPKTTTPKAD